MNRPQRPMVLTVREVSKLLRIQRPKVYDLVREGLLEGFKVGSDWRIRRTSVERLMGPIPDELLVESLEAHAAVPAAEMLLPIKGTNGRLSRAA